MKMDIEIQGYDEILEQLQKMQYGLTEEGLNEYLSDVKKQASEICGLTTDDLTLNAVKENMDISIAFNLKDSKKLECVKNAIERVLPTLPITTKALFEQLVIQIKKKMEETPPAS